MALRDQPYLPLYVQDYLTDEKLNMCSLSTQGVYIKLMCLFHKSEIYGGILLKQKDKQCENLASNFAGKIAKLMPVKIELIESALNELLEERVLNIEGDLLFQKRMVKDNEISIKRADSGKKGGESTQKSYRFAKAKDQPKDQANTEDENEYENEDINIDINVLKSQFEIFRQNYPGTKRGLEIEFDNFKKRNATWKELVFTLSDSLQYQINAKEERARNGGFVPEWKNLSTWINAKCWSEEITITKTSNGTKISKKDNGATQDELAALYARKYAVDSPVSN